MKKSKQDQYYLDVEADSFFQRNRDKLVKPGELRPFKRTVLDLIDGAGVQPGRVLEYGCNIGDLLNYYAINREASCYGIEPSAEAIAYGNLNFPDVHLFQGTIADNEVNDDERNIGSFDLVIIDDVFCWVSRETLFQSVANIDQMIAEGGALFIREFYPLNNSRNRNHHVTDEEIWCYKPAAPHAAMFVASGMYRVISQRVFLDSTDTWIESTNNGIFESRWMETVLRKSNHKFYD